MLADGLLPEGVIGRVAATDAHAPQQQAVQHEHPVAAAGPLDRVVVVGLVPSEIDVPSGKVRGKVVITIGVYALSGREVTPETVTDVVIWP